MKLVYEGENQSANYENAKNVMAVIEKENGDIVILHDADKRFAYAALTMLQVHLTAKYIGDKMGG